MNDETTKTNDLADCCTRIETAVARIERLLVDQMEQIDTIAVIVRSRLAPHEDRAIARAVRELGLLDEQ